MNFNEFMETFAKEIKGQFSEYDQNKSVIIVPVDDSRYQAVIGKMRHNDYYNKTAIEFSSKVSTIQDDFDYKELLVENSKFCHAKFAVVGDDLKVEASAFLDSITEDILKEIIVEVANMADEWEFKLTGMDVY